MRHRPHTRDEIDGASLIHLQMTATVCWGSDTVPDVAPGRTRCDTLRSILMNTTRMYVCFEPREL
jgi:hypothetical protein